MAAQASIASMKSLRGNGGNGGKYLGPRNAGRKQQQQQQQQQSRGKLGDAPNPVLLSPGSRTRSLHTMSAAGHQSGGGGDPGGLPRSTSSVAMRRRDASSLVRSTSGRRLVSFETLVVARQHDPSFKVATVETSTESVLDVAAKEALMTEKRVRFAAEVEKLRISLRSNQHDFVIDPAGAFMRKWDLVTIVALLFTATFTPYEVAVRKTAFDVAFVFNRFIDCIFIWDMGMQFFLMYRLDVSRGGGWVRSLPMIRRHYLRGWFTIDLVSILPFDIVSFALEDGALGKMKALRIIRLMRLLKLVRIMRASRIFQRWETEISVSYSYLSLCKFMIMIVFVGHWLACAWALMHEIVCDEQCTIDRGPESTWLTHWLKTRSPALIPTPHERYTLSMYWSIMTLTSIGYGDIVAQTQPEYVVGTICMLIGAICWAYIIGCTCGIVASLDVHTLQFRQTMDHLNEFMENKCVPQNLRKELRAYFHQAKTLQMYYSARELMEQMSPMLKGKVAMCTVGGFVQHMFGGRLFSDCEPEFLVELSQRFHSAVFAPSECLDEPDQVYHVVRGVVVLGGRIMSNGHMWGEDMVLSYAEYQNTHAALTLTYVEVMTLAKYDLDEVASYFPKAQVTLRKCVVRLVVSRGLRHEALQRAAGADAIGGGNNALGAKQKPAFAAAADQPKRRTSARFQHLDGGVAMPQAGSPKSGRTLTRTQSNTVHSAMPAVVGTGMRSAASAPRCPPNRSMPSGSPGQPGSLRTASGRVAYSAQPNEPVTLRTSRSNSRTEKSPQDDSVDSIEEDSLATTLDSMRLAIGQLTKSIEECGSGIAAINAKLDARGEGSDSSNGGGRVTRAEIERTRGGKSPDALANTMKASSTGRMFTAKQGSGAPAAGAPDKDDGAAELAPALATAASAANPEAGAKADADTVHVVVGGSDGADGNILGREADTTLPTARTEVI